MNATPSIAGRPIGLAHAPYVIAEMSGNHNGSLERALEIVEVAARAGAHALKLQTYTADTLTLDIADGDFFIAEEGSPWKGVSLHALYRQAHTPWEWHEPIMARARERGLACFSSPFDETALEFLEGLRVPAYKVASFEIVHLPLIRAVAATGKPLILSTGMATLGEIGEAVEAARGAGCRELILLKCTSAYPASPEESNVVAVPELRRQFGCEVGLSDHTPGVGAAVAAVAHGATVIEKHVTLRRADGGVDSAFSLEAEELRTLVVETERAWQSLGAPRIEPTDSERCSLVFRRSLYVAEDLRAGDRLTPRNLRIVRPGYGLAPKHYESLLGRRVVKAVKRGTRMSWDLVGEGPGRTE